ALPADPDDHAGGDLRRAAADVRVGVGRRAAPAARAGHGRRPARQPGFDAVHDAGDLSLLRSARSPLADQRAGADSRRGHGTRMSISSPFIQRPVATSLLNLSIILAGAVA